MRALPRQFRPRHRRPRVPVKTGAASFVVLSATLLATGSVSQPSTVDTTGSLLAAPAYAQEVSASLAAPAAPAVPGAPATPVPSRPVAGLDQRQMDNAAAIVRQGREQGMPDKALVVAVATAMQESDLYNVASPAVPSSLRLPHDGISVDHDSVGLFQQRASQGWGTVPELMNPSRSAMLFYDALSRIDGWQRMSVTAAAQAVQRSAFPGAYQKHVPRAEQIVTAIT